MNVKERRNSDGGKTRARQMAEKIGSKGGKTIKGGTGQACSGELTSLEELVMTVKRRQEEQQQQQRHGESEDRRERGVVAIRTEAGAQRR